MAIIRLEGSKEERAVLSQKVRISGVNTHKLPTISNARIQELFQKLEEGDPTARGELVRGNLRLVLSILKRFKNRGESIDDLFQVGCIGLLKAIDNYDRQQKVNFSTYAVPMIVGEIKRYLRDNNAIHISRSLKQLSHRVQQVREKLTKKNLAEPTIAEIANELQVEDEDVILAFNAAYDPLSLYDPVYNDSSDPVYIMDLISDQRQQPEYWLEKFALQEALNTLSPRERRIIEARFFEGKTQMEIASIVGISQAQVSRIEKVALKRIREHFQKEKNMGSPGGESSDD
jgi:RNA polymerase sporulation-specific sigma factor